MVDVHVSNDPKPSHIIKLIAILVYLVKFGSMNHH